MEQLFDSRRPVRYGGLRTAEGIVNFLQSGTGPTEDARPLPPIEPLDEFSLLHELELAVLHIYNYEKGGAVLLVVGSFALSFFGTTVVYRLVGSH